MFLRSTIASLLAMFVLLAASCKSGNSQDLGDFDMLFTGFEPHIGHTLYLKVKDTGGATEGTITPLPVTSAAFSVNIPNIIEEGKAYNVDFWADVDGNGTLDATPLSGGVDHAWRLMRTGTAAGLDITFPHDTNFADIRPF